MGAPLPLAVLCQVESSGMLQPRPSVPEKLFSAYHIIVTDPVTVAQNIWDGVNSIVEHGEAFFQGAASQMCWRLLMESVRRWPMGKDAAVTIRALSSIASY
jgi:hypothetical protein